MKNMNHRFHSAANERAFAKCESRYFSRTPSNCISCYRQEEGLSLRKLCSILGIASQHSAKELCAVSHPSAKYIQILALHEDLSVSEFQRQYTPIKTDAA